MKTMKRFSLSLLLAAAVAHPVFAQQPPAAARGFDPDKVFAAGPIDSINAFNGNVIAAIPLGETYAVSPTLSYSFKAIHNGKTWDYVKRRITIPVSCFPTSGDNCTTVWTDMQAIPDGTANAGFGWRVQFARFILPGDLQANTDRTLLETPDGAQHGMYVSLHDGDPQDGASYTRDGTYLRWRGTGVAGHTAVDTPEGVTYEFTDYKLTQMHDQVKDGSGNYVNRVNIQYGSAAGDPAWPCAYPTISQKITDTKNRTSYVCFQNMNYDGTNRPTVTDVYVGTPAGTGHYAFTHEQTVFGRENYDKGYQYLYLPPTATVPALMSITRPDDSSYGFQYVGTTAHPGIATGNFDSITLPTKGSYRYEYGYYQIPMSYDCPTYEEWLASDNPGVGKREERVANGTVVERTTYGTNGPSGGVEGGFYQCTTEQEGPGYFTALAPGAELSNFVIPGDNHSKTISYYSVWPGYNRLMVDSPDGFKRVEYGLPFTRNASKMRNGLYLSTETYLCTDAANAQCSPTPIRSTYVQYEVDAYVNHSDISTLDHNSRVKKMETGYFDDIDPNTDQPATSTVSNDDFDGLGHYRISETAGFGAATKRRTTTNFNPNAGTFPGTHTLPLTASPWLLNLFTYQETKEIDPSGAVLASAKTEVCFDSNNGFLKRRRTISGGTIAPTKDLLAVFASNGNGEVASESYYGGDGVPLPPGFNTCNTSISGPQYRITHEYASGARTRSQYDGTTFNSYDVDIYPSTSAISTSRDTAGIPTTYVYDVLGRVTEVHPQGAAWTEYEYNIPTTSSGIPSVAVRQRPEGTPKSTAAIAEQRHYFDGLGRLIQRKSAMPNDQWATVNRTYDFMGRIAREYVPYFSTSPEFDTAFTPPTHTEYTYDDLGRNTVIKLPDNSTTTTAYVGNRQRTRTSGIRTSTSSIDVAVPVVEQYDGFGRLVSVTEKSGPTTATTPIGALVTTEYGYDLADRLTSVTMNRSTAGPVQHRFFDYDGRGFLRWESQPESGMTSYQYDARGNVVSKTQGAANTQFDLKFVYDLAGRLTRVDGRNPLYPQDIGEPEFRVMKEFAYGTANATLDAGTPTQRYDLRKGKLTTASRYNYLDNLNLFPRTHKISDRYEYTDTAGRRTGKVTTFFDGQSNARDVSVFTAYDDLGLPVTLKYPMCDGCGFPPQAVNRESETRTYDHGRLKSVFGFLGDTTYWPNGMRRLLPHVNGVLDKQEVGAMARPTQIAFGKYDRCVQPSFVLQPGGGPRPVTTPPQPKFVIHVSVIGTEPILYEWYADGIPISSVPGDPTTVSVEPSVTTEYQVAATNECGQTYSQIAKVTVTGCELPSTGTITAVTQPDGSWVLTPHPTAQQPRSYQWKRLSDNFNLGTAETQAVGTLSLTTTFSLTISDACGATTSNVTIVVPPSMSTTGLVATANASYTQVTVTWPAVTGATSYRVERRSGGNWAQVATPTSNSFVDTQVIGSTTYAYRAATGGSNYSNVDVATTMAFPPPTTGQPITTGTADQMLTAVNKVRAAAGWPAVTWATILSLSDPVVAVNNVITSRQLLACRARMNEARQALGAAGVGYTDADVMQSGIKALHIREVLEAVQ